ncbi:hypothetical protein ACVWWI_006334 [Bradyrhizobium sp. USDA 3686]|uniref:hypothetical protein n=1 Tax=Bradyrhizobium canariense TaxID=255045 RepID=UPI00195A62DB|nr:hypothetical protein [Bradyrhizobium canariense]MBM7488115.1 hypothetical protein [Bradyrhizobium canariense]
MRALGVVSSIISSQGVFDLSAVVASLPELSTETRLAQINFFTALLIEWGHLAAVRQSADCRCFAVTLLEICDQEMPDFSESIGSFANYRPDRMSALREKWPSSPSRLLTKAVVAGNQQD